ILGYTAWPTSVSDTAGKLLFYISGNAVWNRNHQMMPNGKDIFLTRNYDNIDPNPYSTAASSTVIVPEPGNNYRYYVIANGVGRVLEKTTNTSTHYCQL